ncbi:MBL fold metallo-hydrolase [Actinomadura decatromicini]|uniref:MBL fold metallo-hydrolase n=1 Tax=Actinomadura decatromicini TaxID=2604572 RepID=A0A5D3FC14_9ACTN|nr:MBL fold metallo-hydrolase [Actinomadura decatromicini]TYK45434.1 MBL fold metallo-hydrolase [Actinomadura decatromicini]
MDDTTTTITPLGSDVYEIDTRMAGYSGITAGYLILSDRPCLVEPGTSGSAPVVRAALDELGVGPDDLASVVVTHIHLDHAGGVGDIAKMYPRAEVVVHEKGARHLADPSRLMRSARMVYGDSLDTLFGELKPTDAARIRAVEDVGLIDLGGGRRLESHYSPGHAKHHVGLMDSRTGDLYVGDAAGIYIPETADVRPATPPPDFDLDTALDSLGKFRSLGPQRLLFAHYGPVTAVDDTLERSAEELRIWVDTVRDAREKGLDLDHAVAMVVDRTKDRYAITADDLDPELAAKYEVLNSTESNVAGIMHALDRHA